MKLYLSIGYEQKYYASEIPIHTDSSPVQIEDITEKQDGQVFYQRSFTIKDIESLKKDYAEEPVCLMMQQEMEGMERKYFRCF